MRTKILASAALAAAMLSASAANAAIVTINFAGNLTTAYYGNLTGVVSGTATYDTADAVPGEAYQENAITAFSLTSSVLNSLTGQSTVDQDSFAGSKAIVHYVPDSAGEGYGQFELTFQIAHANLPQINFNLVYPDGLSPGSYGLPTSVAAFTDATYAGVRLDDHYGDITLGKITKFEMTSVESPTTPTSPTPEPSAWALALLGFGGAGAALRRRRAALAA